MRALLTLTGVILVALYSAVGAMLMNDWAVTAASGLSLAETIREMSAAGQPYSAAAGIIFALVGGALAFGWGWLVLYRQFHVPGWAACLLWACIIACGAPAFFFASFGNMNSVGDTFFDWNAEAAFAREAPLYLASGIAALLGVVAVVVGVARTVSRTGTSGTLSSPEIYIMVSARRSASRHIQPLPGDLAARCRNRPR